MIRMFLVIAGGPFPPQPHHGDRSQHQHQQERESPATAHERDISAAWAFAMFPEAIGRVSIRTMSSAGVSIDADATGRRLARIHRTAKQSINPGNARFQIPYFATPATRGR